MSFRTDALKKLGGFNVSLGTGSRGMGGEETRVFTEILLGGGTIVYQPNAVTYHYHRRSVDELKRQMYGYGVGLTAYYTSLILEHPSALIELARLLPLAYRDLFTGRSLRSGGLPSDFPKDLLAVNRRGLVKGPYCYLAGVWEERGGARRDTASPHAKGGRSE